MSRLITAAALALGFQARYPGQAKAGTISSISASEGRIESVAAAGIRPFTSPNGKLITLKATEHFMVSGQTIKAGELVEVSERDARQIIALGRAEEATPEEIAEAQADDEPADKKGK